MSNHFLNLVNVNQIAVHKRRNIGLSYLVHTLFINADMSVRLAEKLEQTPGYEHGMPMAILGGLPDYPSTDITKDDLNGYANKDNGVR